MNVSSFHQSAKRVTFSANICIRLQFFRRNLFGLFNQCFNGGFYLFQGDPEEVFFVFDPGVKILKKKVTACLKASIKLSKEKLNTYEIEKNCLPVSDS